jgi:hypothetical protein
LRHLSSLLLVVAAASALADPFGRFGYSPTPSVPSFQLDSNGFRAAHPAADRFAFEAPIARWHALATSHVSQTMATDSVGRSPSKIRSDLTAPGFALLFERGFALRVASAAAPLLTWRDGSADAGIPTPASRWVAVSFRDDQPPLMLGFKGSEVSVVVRGGPGEWRLETDVPYTGWVRVALPFGPRALRTDSAASLGLLAQAAGTLAPFVVHPAPALRSLSVEADDLAVTATWTFDRPGALVPAAAFLSPLGGYGIRIQTPMRRLEAIDVHGPVHVVEGERLQIRFPVRRIPSGRTLLTAEGAGDAGPFEAGLSGSVELALWNLLGHRSVEARDEAMRRGEEFLAGARHVLEPWTLQHHPFDADGNGLEETAAAALLRESLNLSRLVPEANPLLTSLEWRMDWYSWSLWGADLDGRRRAAAIAAVAGALRREPERRLHAAMLQAGLSAERGLQTWLTTLGGHERPTPLLEPIYELRQGLFGLDARPTGEAPFVASLLSELRLFGDATGWVRSTGQGLLFEWVAQPGRTQEITVGAPFEAQFQRSWNVASLSSRAAFGTTELRVQVAGGGVAAARLTLPEWARPVPEATPVPRYEEIRR